MSEELTLPNSVGYWWFRPDDGFWRMMYVWEDMARLMHPCSGDEYLEVNEESPSEKP